MATRRNNYYRARWWWRFKLVLWITVAPAGYFLKKHIHIHLTSIEFNTNRMCWVFQKNKKEREEAKKKEKKNTKRKRELFLPRLLTHNGTTMEKISVREKKCPDEPIYIYIYMLRFTPSIITSSFSLFPLPSYVRLYQWRSRIIEIELLFRDSFLLLLMNM